MIGRRRTVEREPLRSIAILLCFAAAGACLAYAYWRDNLTGWWRESGGGIPYVVFWIMFLFIFFPRQRSVLPICLSATAMTCGLEVLQLWKPVWLSDVRETSLGAALLGSGFAWQDFPPYFLGGVVGFLVLKAVFQIISPADRGQNSGAESG